MMSKKRLFFGTFITLSVIGVLTSSVLLFIHNYRLRKSNEAKTAFIGTHRVLFISSYDYFYKPVQEQIKGIQRVTDKNQTILDIEFMDSKKITDPEYLELFHSSLKLKLSKLKPYDAILLGDDNALDFAIKYRSELFQTTPVIFFGVENLVHARYAAALPNFTGILQQTYLKETIQQAQKLNPKATTVTVIVDDSISGQGDMVQILETKAELPDIQFHIINSAEMTMAGLGLELNRLTNDTILILNSCTYGLDYIFTQQELQYEFVCDNSNIPVYVFNNLGMGLGVAGGMLVNYEKIGQEAAETAVRVAKGAPVELMPLVSQEQGVFVYDLDVLKKFSLNKKMLPKDTILIHSNKFRWDSRKDILIPSYMFAISFVILVGLITALSLIEHGHVKQLRHSHQVMEHLVTHDFLTNLPNRKLISTVYDQVSRSNKEFSVLLVDLDDFKSINDYYSHTCGDIVLKTVSRRFHSIMNDNKFIASRFGGDEFLLIYTNGHIEENDNRELNKLISVFSEPVIYDNKKIFVQASIGIVNSNPDYTSLDDYVANADIAMYEAKREGKNQVAFYDESLKENMRNSQEITKLLEDAIENDGFKVMYQPQIDAENGVIHGYEALCRLKSVPMSPSQFIPVAEENGMIVKIARIVTEKVVQQIAEWRSHKIDLHKVSINYSYGQIKDTSYVEFLKGLLQTYDISPQLIGIEITESLFIENKEQSMKLFRDFSEIGVSLSLDDFGTGYSSLSYLTYLPVDTVKIDKSLIDHYLTNERDKFIKNIVRLVHSLDMKLTVEGVETEYQYNKLKDFKCDYIQGYYFSKPITGNEVENYRINSDE